MQDGPFKAGAKGSTSVSRRWIVSAIGAAAVVGAGAGGFALWQRRAPAYEGGNLTVEQAHEAARMGDVLLIDIRTPREWKATGIAEGAIPIDMRRQDFVQELARAGAAPDRPVALICARGVRSARLGAALSAAGFSKVINVPEGMLGSRAGQGWVRKGLPITEWKDG
jgi:rhodanese-related sulfurtransferase